MCLGVVNNLIQKLVAIIIGDDWAIEKNLKKHYLGQRCVCGQTLNVSYISLFGNHG